MPNIKYVTTYARADSIARKSISELQELKDAGIEHLYCGMETGSDIILKKINKGRFFLILFFKFFFIFIYYI